MSNAILDEILGTEVPEREFSTETTAVATLEVPEPGAAPLVVPDKEQTAITVQSAPVEERMESDFEYARLKMRDLIKKGHEAVDSAIMLAQSGDEPRAYEVVGEMINAMITANKELIKIHETKAKKEAIQNKFGTAAPAPTTDSGGVVNIDKAVFIGKASDLLREIRALVAPPDAQDEK